MGTASWTYRTSALVADGMNCRTTGKDYIPSREQCSANRTPLAGCESDVPACNCRIDQSFNRIWTVVDPNVA